MMDYFSKVVVLVAILGVAFAANAGPTSFLKSASPDFQKHLMAKIENLIADKIEMLLSLPERPLIKPIKPNDLHITRDNLKANPNALVDLILALVDEAILELGLDPIELVNEEIFGVDLVVWIGGYSSMVRDGESSVIYGDGTLDITVTVQMTNLAANISFATEIFGIDLDAGATGTIESVDFKMALRFVEDPTNKTISGIVDDFQIYDIGTITVEVFGLGIFDYLADAIADILANLLKFLVPVLLDGIVKDIIQQVLDAILNAL